MSGKSHCSTGVANLDKPTGGPWYVELVPVTVESWTLFPGTFPAATAPSGRLGQTPMLCVMLQPPPLLSEASKVTFFQVWLSIPLSTLYLLNISFC